MMGSTNFISDALLINAKQTTALIPYLILSLGILLSVIAAGYQMSRSALRLLAIAALGPFIAMLFYSLRMPTVELFGGALAIDPMTRLVGALVASLGLVVALFAKSYSSHSENSEWLSFALVSILSLSLLPACSDLITFFVILETASIAGYLLAASDRKRVLSLEAGLKYLLSGAFASALFLMGVAQLYGFVGSLDFSAIQLYLSGFSGGSAAVPAMVHAAAALIVVAFAYKVGLAPFHMWSPDVYQGGPTALSAFLATATKVALFSSFAVVLHSTGLMTLPTVYKSLYGLAMISIVVGSLLALVQRHLKRMLAYSGVVNAGYATLALISGTEALGAMFSFLALYSVALIVGFAFAEDATLKDGSQSHSDIEISSLETRAPNLSPLSKALFTVAIFSLAGIPPFPGFLAKYQILSHTWNYGYVWGAGLILVGSILGLGYYLRTLVPLYMKSVSDTGSGGYRNWFFHAPTVVSAMATLMLIAVLLGFSRVNQWVDYISFFAR